MKRRLYDSRVVCAPRCVPLPGQSQSNADSVRVRTMSSEQIPGEQRLSAERVQSHCETRLLRVMARDPRVGGSWTGQRQSETVLTHNHGRPCSYFVQDACRVAAAPGHRDRTVCSSRSSIYISLSGSCLIQGSSTPPDDCLTSPPC